MCTISTTALALCFGLEEYLKLICRPSTASLLWFTWQNRPGACKQDFFQKKPSQVMYSKGPPNAFQLLLSIQFLGPHLKYIQHNYLLIKNKLESLGNKRREIRWPTFHRRRDFSVIYIPICFKQLHTLELTGLKICFGSSLPNIIVSEARTMNGTISRSGCQYFFFFFF